MQVSNILMVLALSATLHQVAFGEAQEAATEGVKNSPSIFENMPPWQGWGDPFYNSSENFFIQSVEIHGRMNYQVVHIWGHDANGDYFEDGYDELRRLWVGGKIKFLDYFTVGGNAIFSSDERPQGRQIDVGYQKFFDLYFAADLKKMFHMDVFDRFQLRYGRIKHNMTYTGRQTQRFNKTVERTAMSNKLFYPFAPMSITLDTQRGNWKTQFSLYGTANGGAAYGSLDYKEWGNWDEGLAVYGWTQYDYRDRCGLDTALFTIEASYNFADLDGGDSSWLGYQWALGSYTYLEQGRWSVLLEAAIGNNGDAAAIDPDRQGWFGGAQSEVTYDFFDSTLEGVFQIQFLSAENDEGLRVDSRYLGLPHTVSGGIPADLNGRYCHRHFSTYLGLNLYLPDDRNKFMLGIEWEELAVRNRETIEATTFWAAYRMYF